MTRNPEIPLWAREQIQKGLESKGPHSTQERKREVMSSEVIRERLLQIQTEFLITYFTEVINNPSRTKFDSSDGGSPADSAYIIAMYQRALQILGTKIRLDGVYTDTRSERKSETQRSIEEFQRKNQIGVDGIPGIETARKILEQLTKLVEKRASSAVSSDLNPNLGAVNIPFQMPESYKPGFGVASVLPPPSAINSQASFNDLSQDTQTLPGGSKKRNIIKVFNQGLDIGRRGHMENQ